MTLPEAGALLDVWAEAMEKRLAEFAGPVLRIEYENLVKKPTMGVDDLARFAFHETGRVPDYEAGRNFVDPRLKHYG